MAKADLHIHTYASDGQMSPEQVVQEAARLNLCAIAITDHDTIEAVFPAQKEAQNHEIDVLPGVEITTSFQDKECHLLAYGFKTSDHGLNDLLKAHQQARVTRARWIIGELRKQGLDLDIEEVIAEASGRNVGRPHIAEILRKKGYIRSISEAFIRYLSDEALGVIKNNYRDVGDVITTVKQAGGVAVLAHPGRLYTQAELNEITKSGLDGIEVMHPSHNYEIQKAMEAFATKHNLLTTGGSDYHGRVKKFYRHLGTLAIHEDCIAKIAALSDRRKGYQFN